LKALVFLVVINGEDGQNRTDLTNFFYEYVHTVHIE